MRSQCIKLTATALAAISISLSFAAPYAAGSKVEPFTAKDQHDNGFTFKPADTRFLLVSHDMETGKKANAVLSPLGKEFLGSEEAVYMANLFGIGPVSAGCSPSQR